MRFILDITTENDAFSPNGDRIDGKQVARILLDLADRVYGPLHSGDAFYLKDDNGNTVGSAVVVNRPISEG